MRRMGKERAKCGGRTGPRLRRDSNAPADVRVLWIYVNPGTVDIDNVRAE
jgi:hypothetical protein